MSANRVRSLAAVKYVPVVLFWLTVVLSAVALTPPATSLVGPEASSVAATVQPAVPTAAGRSIADIVSYVGELGGPCRAVAASGNYVYFNAGRTLAIVDASQPGALVTVGQILLPEPVQAVTLDGEFAYVADGDHGLIVLNIADPTAPTKVAEYGGINYAHDVALSGSVAVIGRDGGVTLIDVSTPSVPFEIGQFTDLFSGQAVAADGNLVYMVSGDAGVMILDISDPAAVTQVGGLYTSGFATDMVLYGARAYVYCREEGIEVFDVSDTTSPGFMGLYESSAEGGALAVSGNQVYLASVNVGLEILDVNSIGFLSWVNTYYDEAWRAGVVDQWGLAVADGRAYVGADTLGLFVVDVAASTAPTGVGSWATGGDARDVALSGSYAVVADGGNGYHVVDVSDPAHPLRRGSRKTEFPAVGVATADGTAYVAAGIDLFIVDLANPDEVSPAAVFAGQGSVEGVALTGQYAVLAEGETGVEMVNVQSPTYPWSAGLVDTPGQAHAAAIAGHYAYVADGSAGLQVLDIADPQAASIVGNAATDADAYDVAIVGNRAYVALLWIGVAVFDISDPAAPTPVVTYNPMTWNEVKGVAVSGYVYLANGESGLQVIDVPASGSPDYAGGYDTAGLAEHVAVDRHYVFVADNRGGLVILHIDYDDCNSNGLPDFMDIAADSNADLNGNGKLDECEPCEGSEAAKLAAADADEEDQFGGAVALSGDRVLVGAPFDDENGTDAGAAYVFAANGATWSLEAKLVAPDGVDAQEFGHAVALDGDVAVVGAWGDDDAGGQTGAVYVYVRDANGIWVPEAKVVASDGAEGDRFGSSVALHSARLVVGASGDENQRGAAYVYYRYGMAWVNEKKLTASDGADGDQFGAAVALAGDVLVVGAPGDDDRGDDSGSAYVFRWEDTGQIETGKLLADDGVEYDAFGGAVAVDGDTILVGAAHHWTNGEGSGAAYVSRADGSGWTTPVPLASERQPSWNSRFGSSVAVSGNVAVVGADHEDEVWPAGAAYVFVFDGTTWKDHIRLRPANWWPDDRFGAVAAIAGDLAVIGAPGRDESVHDEGAVYLFRGVGDCNQNKWRDLCDIAHGISQDVDTNGVPDECGTDCNTNGVSDEVDIAAGTSADCNTNGVPDECDIASGASADADTNGVPDECTLQHDCNSNGAEDDRDIATGVSADCNSNAIPDECDIADGTARDCNSNGRPDSCDIYDGVSQDCQPNGVPDECDLAGHNCCTMDHGPGCSDPQIEACVCANDAFCCETDWDWYCMNDVEPSGCGTCAPASDCNANGVPDECDLTSIDLDVGDLLVGGDGSGSGPFGAGINPRTGALVAANIYAGSGGNTGPRFIAVDGNSGSANLAAVDGVFRPGGSTQIDSLGGRFTFPNTGLGTYDAVRNGYSVLDASPVGTPIRLMDQPGVERQGIGIHCNSGVTFDLAALRASHPGVRFTLLEGVAGLSQEVMSTVGAVQMWVVVDGTERFRGTFTASGTTYGAVSVPLTGSERFLTLATTDYGSMNYDHAVFADLRLRQEGLNDCNTNGVPDECEIAGGTSPDCQGNGVLDECELALGNSLDCNTNAVPDECDVAAGTSPDCQPNGVPDECELIAGSGMDRDCNTNGVPDECDLAGGASADLNSNGRPDECEPNLTVTACAAPTEVAAGQSLSIDWTVTNAGGVTVWGPWADRVYLSSDAIVGGDTELMSVSHAESLPPGGDYQVSESAPIAGDLAGEYWIVVVTDADNWWDEPIEADNARVCGSVQIHDTQAPETTITAGPPDGGYVTTSGISISLAGTDNHTPADALEFAYCVAPAATGCDPASQPFATNTTATIEGLAEASNPYVFRVVARDASGNIDATPAQRTFTVDWTAVAIVSHSPSGASATAVCAVQLTFSEPPVGFAAEDIALTGPGGPVAISQLVNLGEPRKFEFRFACQTEAGVYEFSVGPDVFDVAGNAMSAAYTGSFSIAMPDLTPTALDVPTSGLSGAPLVVGWTVENRGVVAATGGWKDAVYLSTDNAWGGDTLLAEFRYNGSLAPGASYQRTQNVPLPAMLEGEYWIIIVTDAGGVVTEHREGEDNRRISGSALQLSPLPYPDLDVTEVSGPPTAWPGQSITVCWTVTNAGDGGTGAAGWTDELYLSFDQAVDAGSDILLGRYANPSSLNAGDGYQQCQTVTVPGSALGCYYFVVRTDYANQVVEYRRAINAEGNNVGSSDPCTTVALPPPADLRVTQVIAPDSGWSGQTATVSWEVTNFGQSPTPASWQDAVYLSLDDVLDSSDTLVCAVPHSGVLYPYDAAHPEVPGTSYSVTKTCNLPRWLVGTFHVFVLTDSGNHVPEQGYEGNNSKSADTLLTIALTPPPDLEVTVLSVTGPESPDRRATVRWTVANLGGSATAEHAWKDAVYVSTDASMDTVENNVLVGGPYTHSGDLDPDGAYEQAATVTLPRCLDGTYYLFVVTDVDDSVEEFLPEYESNNNDAHQSVAIATIEPDLAVNDVEAPTNGFSGQPIAVHWEVSNIGTGDTEVASFVDRVYLSADAVLDQQHDSLLGAVTHSGVVTAADGYAETRTLKLPVGISGEFHVFVVVDALQQVAECGATANNVGEAIDALQVEFTEADLVVPVAEASTNGASGQPIAVSWTVSNAGERATDATAWTDAVYLSVDDTLNRVVDVRLATFDRTTALDAGESYSRAESVTVPIGVSGTRYVFVCTDSGAAVVEPGREDNNCTIADRPVEVLATEPDLAVTDVLAPASAHTGDAITVQWTVHNYGERATTETGWVDKIYCSADAAVSGNDAWVATIPHTGALAVDGVYQESRTVKLASPGPGPHYILVRTDTEGKINELGREQNNVGASAAPIEVICVEPDLQVTQVSAPQVAQSSLAITVSWTVVNAGERTTPSVQWSDAVYLSADSEFDPASAVQLGTFSRNAALAVGATYTRSAAVTLPNGLDGVQYLFVVADAGDQIEECAGDGNNVSEPVVLTLGLTHFDLQVAAVTAADTGYAGQETAVQWTVTNAGSSSIPALHWRDSVYLSLDLIVDPDTDPFLGFVERHEPVAAGLSYNAAATLAIPSATAPGEYHVLVVADSADDVYEHEAEDNNLGQAAGVIVVQKALEADLVVMDVGAPVSGSPGQTAEFAWTVTNSGANAAVGSWYDSVYLSADATWDLDDVLVAKVRHDGAVAAAGGTYTASVSVALPGMEPGPRRVIVRCDINNHIPEGSAGEANNIGVSAGATQIQMIALTLGVPLAASLPGSGTAQYYQVEVAADETLRVTLDADTEAGANELYIRYGQIPDRGHYDAAFEVPYLPDQEATIPTTKSGTYYVLVYGQNVPSAPEHYTILAESLPFSVSAISPNTGGNTSSVTVEITGARFEPDTSFTLITDDRQVITPAVVYAQGKSQAFATYDLRAFAAGLVDVKAANSDGAETVATDLFEILDGGGPHLVGRIVAPAKVRAGRSFPVRIEYSNIGSVDMPAPVLELSSPWPVLMSLSADGPFEDVGGVRVLGINPEGPAGILPPGAFGIVNVHVFVPDEGEWAHRMLNLGLRWWTGPGLVDWTAEEELLRRTEVVAGQWQAAWSRLVTHVGPTWSDFERAVGEMATRSWLGGERIYSVRELLERELDQAWESYPSWIRGTVVDNETDSPLAGATVIAVDTNGARVFDDLTDGDGVFAITVPSAAYDLVVVDRYLVEPASVTVGPDQDAVGMVLRTIPPPPTMEVSPGTPPETPQASPALARDRAGDLHMVWTYGQEVWHARLDGAAWDISGPVGGNQPTEPRITQGPASQGDNAVTVLWQEKSKNESELVYAVGWPEDARSGGLAWSAPVPLTQDGYSDQSPAILLTPDGRLMTVWLKRDAGITDDTDLYYELVLPVVQEGAALVSGDGIGLLAPGARLVLDDPGYAGGLYGADDLLGAGDDFAPRGPYCLTIGGTNTNKEVYMYGPKPFCGPLGFGMEVKACADWGDCKWAGSGNISGFFKFGEVTCKLTGGGSAKYVVEKKEESCDWKFVEGALNWGIQYRGKIFMGNIFIYPGVPIPWSEWGFIVILGGGGAFGWKGDLGWPDSGSGSVTIGGGVYGGMDLRQVVPGAKVEIGGEVTGTATVSVPLDMKFKVCFTIYGEASWGMLKGKLEKTWCTPSKDAARPAPLEYPPGAYVLRADDMSETEPYALLVITVDPLLGTGAVYPGQTVLADVSSDVRNDTAAALAQTSSGEVLTAWTKDSDDPATAIGSSVVVASHVGGAWTAPVVLAGPADFNFTPQVAVDGGQSPLVVWSQAAAVGLNLQNTAEELMTAMKQTDLVYSRRVGDVWTPPALLAGGSGMPGRDERVVLAADGAGRVVAAWLHTDLPSGAESIYAAWWDGMNWSAPVMVATSVLTQNLAGEFAGSTAVIAWAADADGDGAATPNDQSIFYVTGDGSGWSTPQRLPKPAAAAPASARSERWGPFGAPPKECCACTTTSDCDDLLFCNGEEYCSPNNPASDEKGCMKGDPPCNPADKCDEDADECPECATDADCNDGVICTKDKCSSEYKCIHEPQDDLCQDGVFCNGEETCHHLTGCTTGMNPCPAETVCIEEKDACGCGWDESCDDGVACTVDRCVDGVCQYSSDAGRCPDDGNECNGPEHCDAKLGKCVSGPPMDCSDGNRCTVDTCTPGEGCSHSTLYCGTSTGCMRLWCDPATGCEADPVDCNDGDSCTADSCDPNTGCQHSSLDCKPHPESITSGDPNAKIGPASYGPEGWVAGGQDLLYTIRFENVPEATAPAQVVTITDALDGNLDWRTFRVRDLGFGATTVGVSDNLGFFQADVDLRSSQGIIVRVHAGIDVQTGVASWTLKSIDPATGELPAEATAGFLPPNDPAVHDGEGYVTFTVRARTDVPTGTVIDNRATIVFDINEPIDTNDVTNTLDLDTPSSMVAALPEESPGPQLDLTWTASDGENGSGLAAIVIFASIEGGPYEQVVSAAADATSAVFAGARGGAVCAFYSVAADHVGNVEAVPPTPDAVTAIAVQPPAAPQLGGATAATVRLVDIGAVNLDSIEHAVFEETTGRYVGPDGRLAADAYWQPRAGWADMQVRALAPRTTYRFKARARSERGESAFGAVTAITTSRVGDVNGDNIVDAADLALVQAALGGQYGDAGFDARADLNGDDRITFADVGIVRASMANYGDIDGDGDIDRDDYDGFAACLAGPSGGLVAPGCSLADFNHDGDVDLADFAVFAARFNEGG